MQIIAHRGASFDHADNTLDAFSQAIARGSSCVETDVRVCSDGALILCHDPVIKAHEGPGICVAEHTLAHIRANASGGGNVLELDDLLDLLRKNGCQVHLEIKPGPLQVEIVDEVCARMLLSGVRGLVSSFDPGIVARAGKSGVATLLLLDDLPLDAPRRARACGATALGLDVGAVKGDRIGKVAAQIATYCFTVNTLVDLRRCVQAGLAGVYSDHPDLVQVLRRRLGDEGRPIPQARKDIRMLDNLLAAGAVP